MNPSISSPVNFVNPGSISKLKGGNFAVIDLEATAAKEFSGVEKIDFFKIVDPEKCSVKRTKTYDCNGEIASLTNYVA